MFSEKCSALEADVKELGEAILKWGKGLGNDIVKVDMFLNHRIDTGLMFRMGEEIAAHFADERPMTVLTVEASGIALALTAAHALGDLPVVFAKKSGTVVQDDETAQAKVYSFTHKTESTIRVEKRYLPIHSRVLIVDDFLADGQAALGMIEICRQLDCPVCGVAVGIEKGFQPGGRMLREKGIQVLSLAVVEKIENGTIRLRDD